jgi:hypothetical protein
MMFRNQESVRRPDICEHCYSSVLNNLITNTATYQTKISVGKQSLLDKKEENKKVKKMWDKSIVNHIKRSESHAKTRENSRNEVEAIGK